MNRTLGFTLIEIMVALAIFTVVSVTLIRTSSLSVRQSGQLLDRTTAWSLAENEMTRIRLLERSDETFPAAGTDRRVIELSRGSWEIETRIETTENEFVRRVTVSAFRSERTVPDARLVGFVGRY